MRVQYIKHSGFLIEFDEAALVFDYYQGEFDLPDTNKPIYFFVSHKHGDHFNLDIFQYVKRYENITFILSKDCKMSPNYMERHGILAEARERILYVKEHQTISISEQLQIQTLDSTDQGVAYLVTCSYDGVTRSIYHAGDLNWWTWIGETEKEYEQMTKKYQEEMGRLKQVKIDLAMVVLDPRQEDRFWWGFDLLMKTADVSCVIPMHCWEDYTVIGRLKAMEESKTYREKIVEVHHPKEWLTIDC